MFIGIFSIPKKDPGSLSQLADNIPKLNPARPNKKNNAEIAITAPNYPIQPNIRYAIN